MIVLPLRQGPTQNYRSIIAPRETADGGRLCSPRSNPLIAIGVLASTAVTDAAYVFFHAAVGARHRIRAANWSAIWYMLPAFAVISYFENPLYVAFAAAGHGSAHSSRSAGCCAAGRRNRNATIRRDDPEPPRRLAS
jgi:hypothetical protein